MSTTDLVVLAQDDGGAAAAGGAGILMLLIYFALIALSIVGVWKVFTKAGKPGWASIIPIYNMIVLLEIVGKPIWWLVLLFIPCVNLVIAIMLFIDLAKCFGKDAAYGLGLFFLGFIFFPLLGFSDATYRGPVPSM